MTCAHYSLEISSTATVPCCGGKTRVVELHACACEEVEQELCNQDQSGEEFACCKTCPHNTDPPKHRSPTRRSMVGVGQNLKSLISWFAKACEACEEFAQQMNEWGPDGCVEHKEEILDHLEGQAKERGLPYSRKMAWKMVWIAIMRERFARGAK